MYRYVFVGALFAFATPSIWAEGAGTLWETVYSPDLPTYPNNLRAEGFPDDVVGLLVSHEMNARFGDRERALQPTVLTEDGLRNFWSLERRAESRLLWLEKQMLTRVILGVAPGTTEETDWISKNLGDLPFEDRDLVRAIYEDYDDLIQRVHDASFGFLTLDDRNAIIYLEKERARDLSEILDADRLLDFQIHYTAVGKSVIEDLQYFEPTTQELRDYYTLMISHGLELIALEPEGGDSISRRIIARAQTFEDLETMWPRERIDRLRFAMGYPYKRIYPLVHRLGFTTSAADDVLSSLRTLTEGMQAIDGENPMPSVVTQEEHDKILAERHQQVRTLHDQHCAEVIAILGDEGFNEYYQLFGEVLSRQAIGQQGWLQIDVWLSLPGQ